MGCRGVGHKLQSGSSDGVTCHWQSVAADSSGACWAGTMAWCGLISLCLPVACTRIHSTQCVPAACCTAQLGYQAGGQQKVLHKC